MVNKQRKMVLKREFWGLKVKIGVKTHKKDRTIGDVMPHHLPYEYTS
jgi:hypothetical protein